MRYLLNILVVVAIGLVGGGLSAKWAVESERGIGALKIGQWTSWPLAGSVDADPYTKARVATDGTLPLGAAEGLAFYLMVDEDGQPLRHECNYLLSGQTPQARLWTLAAQPVGQNPPSGRTTANATLFSQTLLRATDGAFAVNIGPAPSPGNWLKTTATGPMKLVVRLYDTPLTGSAGLVDPVMPALTRRSCPS